MTHLNPDRLADRALGTDDPLTAAEEKHLAGCAECRNELAELSRIAELGRNPERVAHQLVPTEAIWQSIQVQLASQATAPATTEAAAEPAPSSPTVTELPRRTPRPRSWFLVAAAAAVGLIIGAGVTTVAVRDRVEVTSSDCAGGTAGTDRAGHRRARQRPRASRAEGADRRPPTPDRYREVWLINTDGQRMYTLGVLPDDGQSQLPSPARTRRTAPGFTIVDVSIEPYDGNPAHSRESQVRGILPT